MIMRETKMDWPVSIPPGCLCEWQFSERLGWWRRWYDPLCPRHHQTGDGGAVRPWPRVEVAS